MELKKKIRLYVITDGRFKDEVETTKLALEGGATSIQLRMKNASTRKMIETGKKMRKITGEYDALLFINDRVDVALAVNADGVHLGQDDMPCEIAKKIAPNLIIGISATNLNEAIVAEKKGADYIGAGSVFPTTTKEDARVMGIEELRKIAKNAHIPVVAIGGINHENARKVLETGVDGIAVISAIVGANDVKKAARKMREIVDEFI